MCRHRRRIIDAQMVLGLEDGHLGPYYILPSTASRQAAPRKAKSHGARFIFLTAQYTVLMWTSCLGNSHKEAGFGFEPIEAQRPNTLGVFEDNLDKKPVSPAIVLRIFSPPIFITAFSRNSIFHLPEAVFRLPARLHKFKWKINGPFHP